MKRITSVLLCSLMVALALQVMPPSPVAAQEASDPAPDGLSESNPAASCWAIKQDHPSSPDGTYWLQTPKLVAPQQFYCDMTTDGGGWVLVGRGREDWGFLHIGQGNPAALHTNPTGTSAFSPVALHGDTIDGLLNGVAVKDLDDGVRIRRATNQQGSNFQEIRWHFKRLENWAWGFGGGMYLDDTIINGQSFPGGNTRDSRERRSGEPSSPLHNNSYNNAFRTWTYPASDLNWRTGFAMGSQVSGSSSSNSYLWHPSNGSSPIAFAQVFIRPKLQDLNYEALPQDGLGEDTIRDLMQISTEGERESWGTTGLLLNGDSYANRNQVGALVQLGDTVYVGGKFSHVQKGANGTRIQQARLAAFDVNTGEWRPDFRPTVNGNIWSLIATPDGKLIVGGEFSQVNGQAHGGVVSLDPTTGEINEDWLVQVRRAGGSETPWGTAMTLDREWVYIGGRFNRIDTPTHSDVIVGNVARVRWSDGFLDATWKPNTAARVQTIDVDDEGENVYMGGFFKSVNGVATENVVKVSATVPVQVSRWNWTPSAPAAHQQAIVATEGRVYQGGSEHNIDMYDADSEELMRRHITNLGGDIQVIKIIGDVVYVGCHCKQWAYSDTMTWSNMPNPSRVDVILDVFALDKETLEIIPEWRVPWVTENSEGAWALMEDSNGCLWSGGDFNRGTWQAGGFQWLGGFAKTCPRDTVAPTVPGNFTATFAGGNAQLGWTSSNDNSGGAVRYEVLRDDRVVATVSTVGFTETIEAEHRYAVRSVDALGNRSATTPVLSVEAPPEDSSTELVPWGAEWSWRYEAAAPSGSWLESGFDDSSWSVGSGTLGFGSAGLGTDISVGAPSPRPLAAYFRSSFVVDDPAELVALDLTTVADDGVVVYVNGVEVGRSNLAPGPVTHDATWALSSPRTANASNSPATFTIPVGLLNAGENTIAVQVQLGYRSTPDVSFDLSVIAR